MNKYFNIDSPTGGGREPEPDVAKGIGIILVVIGHCSGCLPLHALLTSFHMPLFFFLSGLFLFRKQENFEVFLIKKTKTLLFPCLVFGLILSTYSTCMDILRHDDIIPYGYRYIGLFVNMRHNPFPGSLWFFPALFLVEFLMYSLHGFCKRKTTMLAGSVLFTLFGLIIHHYYRKGLPWSLDIALYCTIFTLVGYYVRDIIWKDKSTISYIIVLVIFLFSSYANFVYIGGCVDLYSCRLGFYPLFFLSAFCGIYLVTWLSKIMVMSKIMRYFGQNSMLVYSLHFLLLKLTEILILKVVPVGLVSCLLQASTILVLLIPIMNVINRRFRWMTGKF